MTQSGRPEDIMASQLSPELLAQYFQLSPDARRPGTPPDIIVHPVQRGPGGLAGWDYTAFSPDDFGRLTGPVTRLSRIGKGPEWKVVESRTPGTDLIT